MKKKRHDRRVGMLQPPNCGEFPLSSYVVSIRINFSPNVLSFYCTTSSHSSISPMYHQNSLCTGSNLQSVLLWKLAATDRGGPLVLSPIRSKSCLHSASKDLVCGVVGREGGTTHRGTVLLTDNSTQ